MNSKTILRLISTAALAVMLGTSLNANAQMYKWVDENGVVHFGDRIPPRYADKESERVNRQGVTVETKELKKSGAEIDEERRAAREAEKRAAYDRFLLTTYQSPNDIIAARENHLATLDGQILLASKAQTEREAGLATLRNRETELINAGKPVPANIITKIIEFENDVTEGRKSLQTMRAERLEIENKFNQDIKRFNSLRAGRN